MTCMFANKVFENAKSLSEAGNEKKYVVLQHIIFSTFFLKRKEEFYALYFVLYKFWLRVSLTV